jgi:prevent-host-death family protein
MKRIRFAEDILPLGEFKTHASSVLRRLKESGRPVVITQNGRPAAVLSTPEDFDRLRQRARFMRAVGEGLADSDAGRVVSDRELSRQLDEEFGPLDTE